MLRSHISVTKKSFHSIQKFYLSKRRMTTSKTITLKAYAEEGLPQKENFEIVTSTVQTDLQLLEEGDVAIQVLAMSADPYLRGRIKSSGILKLGDPLSGFVAGKVIASKNSAWVTGDLIGASLPFSTVQIIKKDTFAKTYSWKLTGLVEEKDINLGVGILGMPGSTAYGGLIDILRPNKGETIFISAASGAVGSLVGMIAKQVYNCKVIGSCGGQEKCALVKEKFGFDHAIDYKTCRNADDLMAALKVVAPDGIDMYFENVGGFHFEASFNSLRPGGRIAVCGQIAEYNSREPNLCKINPMKMIYSAQRIEGFTCGPWITGKKGSFLKDMHGWLTEGKLIRQETVFNGIEAWIDGFQSLFTGANVGKVVVRV